MRTRGQAVTRARGSYRAQEGIGPGGQHGHELLERDGELRDIDLALAGAAQGQGRLIVLYGTAGVGRSSLLTAALQLASSRRFDAFSARGSAWERGYAFGVARQLLETRVAEEREPQLRSLFDGAAAAALPALGLASPRHDAERNGFDQIYGLYLVVSRLAAERHLILAVDDVHWCDRPSLDFLCFLGHRARQLPIVVVLSWRRGEPGVQAGRLQALAGEYDTVFLAPQPLSAGAVRDMMARELETDPDPEVVNLVRARTGGVPSLVSDFLTALRVRQIVPAAAAAETIAAITPERTRRDVAARLSRHPESVRRLAYAIAVLGDGCPLSRAAQLARVSPEKAPQHADALVRAGFLRLDDTLSFLHPLLRDATYQTLSTVEQAGLHSAAAALMVGAEGDVEPRRIAEHLLRSEPARDARFGQVLQKAGISAIREGELSLARRCLHRALQESGAGANGETLAQLGMLSLQVGDIGAAEQYLRQALPLARSEADRLSIATACAEAVAAARGCEPAIQLLNLELDRCARRDSRLRMGLQAAISSLRLCYHIAQPELATEPLPRLDSGGTADLAILAVRASLAALYGTAGAQQVMAACRTVIAGSRWDERAPRRCGERAGWQAAPGYFAFRTALLAEDLDLVEEALPAQPGELHTGTATDHDLATIAVRCQLRLCRGDLLEAEADAAAVIGLIEALPPTALRSRMRDDATVVRAVVALHRGSAHDARQRLTALTACGQGMPRHPAALPLEIMLRLHEGRAEEAVHERADAGAEGCEAPGGITAPGVSLRPALALACQSAGRLGEAVTLAAQHVAAARAWGAPSHLARALLTQAAVSPGSARRELIEQALELLGGKQGSLEFAQAQIELGAALRRERRRKEAQEHLIKGADLAHHCGASVLVERAHAELVAAGARPRRRAFSGLDSLTPSERRVAELAATEMTTRQIAQVLTISMKTVAGQLTAVYHKLDVHDRRALAAVLTGAEDCGARNRGWGAEPAS